MSPRRKFRERAVPFSLPKPRFTPQRAENAKPKNEIHERTPANYRNFLSVSPKFLRNHARTMAREAVHMCMYIYIYITPFPQKGYCAAKVRNLYSTARLTLIYIYTGALHQEITAREFFGRYTARVYRQCSHYVARLPRPVPVPLETARFYAPSQNLINVREAIGRFGAGAVHKRARTRARCPHARDPEHDNISIPRALSACRLLTFSESFRNDLGP